MHVEEHGKIRIDFVVNLLPESKRIIEAILHIRERTYWNSTERRMTEPFNYLYYAILNKVLDNFRLFGNEIIYYCLHRHHLLELLLNVSTIPFI